MQHWFVYILQCADNSLYTGVTTDLEKRLWQHNHCNKTGAKYTRPRRPVKLVYQEIACSRSSACSREYQIKNLPRHAKLKLVADDNPLQ